MDDDTREKSYFEYVLLGFHSQANQPLQYRVSNYVSPTISV